MFADFPQRLFQRNFVSRLGVEDHLLIVVSNSVARCVYKDKYPLFLLLNELPEFSFQGINRCFEVLGGEVTQFTNFGASKGVGKLLCNFTIVINRRQVDAALTAHARSTVSVAFCFVHRIWVVTMSGFACLVIFDLSDD